MGKKPMAIVEAIKGYIIDCRTRGRSGRTIEWYEQKLTYFSRWISEENEVDKLNSVTVDHLRLFVLHLQTAQLGRHTIGKNEDATKISPLTVKGYVQVVKGFFNWCQAEELIRKNPAARLSLPSVPTYMIPTFTSEHIKMMLDACDRSTPIGYRDYTIILVLLETSIRVSELCGLRLQDVHEDHIACLARERRSARLA